MFLWTTTGATCGERLARQCGGLDFGVRRFDSKIVSQENPRLRI